MMDILAIKQWSREEKLRMMEAIWEDLSEDEQSIQSPTWHESLLQDTEQRVQSGKEGTLDWQDAKKEVRKRFDED